ncbi:MAG TPA: TIGR02391 family protein [Solirubrobacteraceae bacterium]
MIAIAAQLTDFIPTPAEVVSMPLDQLALRLLAYERALEDSGGNGTRNFVVNAGWWSDYEPMGEVRRDFLRALVEAWDWLLVRGLVSTVDPRQRGEDWTFVTRRGRALLDDQDGLAKLRSELRLDVDLHEAIAERVRAQWSLGEFESAAFLAMREVEIRVRDLAGASTGDLGVPLMQASFRENGPLADSSLESAEQQATMALFWGAIGVFKNPSSHRQVEYDDPTAASEVVLLADLLLRLLDGLAARLGK